MTEQTKVEIIGDASSAVAASKQSSTAIAEAAALMKSKLAEASASVSASMDKIGLHAKEASERVATSAERIHASGERMKGGWEGVASAMGKLGIIAAGVMTVLAGGEAFEKSIEATNELTAENLKLSKALGVSLEKASGVHAAMHKLGIGVDTVVGASQKMDRQLARNEQAFKSVGIATRDANGHFRTNLDILVDANAKLATYQAGVDRTALSQILFGRGAGDLGGLMRLTNEQIEEGSRVAKELGLVTTQEGVTSMREYKAATNEVSEIFEAFKVRLGQQLLPVLTQIAEWFQHEGTAAIDHFAHVLTEGIHTVERFVIAIRGVGAYLELVRTWMNAATETVDAFKEKIKVTCDTIQKVLTDALTLNWGAIEGDWDAGMAKIDEIASRHAVHITETMNKARKAVGDAELAFSKVGGPSKDQDGLTGKKLTEWSENTPSAKRLDDPGSLTRKPKKAKTEKGPSDLDRWRAELGDKVLAEERAGNDTLQMTAAFWQSKLKLVKSGSKEELEVRRESTRSEIALLREGRQETTATIKQREQLESDAAKTDIALARMTLDEKLENLKRLEDAGAIGATRAAKQRLELNAQLAALDRQEEQREFQIKLAALQQQAQLYREGTKERGDFNRQIEVLEAQHQQRLMLLSGKASAKLKADQAAVASAASQRWTGMANSWAGALAKMATLQQGFMSTVKGLWQGLAGVVEGIIEQILQRWIVAQLTKIGLVKTEQATTIAGEAALAGAGGVASMAAAPFPINTTAPAFGAAMAAAALAFAPGVAAEGGWDVPGAVGNGMDGRGGMSAVIHPREMVLPAHLADIIRGGGGGATHVHIHATDAASVKRLLQNNRGAVVDAIKSAVRDGKR